LSVATGQFVSLRLSSQRTTDHRLTDHWPL